MVRERGANIVIIGGAKSGKSRYALDRASHHPGRKAYVATAQAFDEEMEERIRRHREERPPGWETFEEPLEVPALLKKISGSYDAVVLDCLTIWLSNLMLRDEDLVDRSSRDLLSLLGEQKRASLYLVSNEVGMGIVPDNALSRRFRDHAGSLNQRISHAADEVYLVTAGIPLKIK
ncbi:MAG: bifunctional adenosylcobinamide kinase/adenosylcobinamide-phosphate guanylyltransferase [Nitrospirae bacterium]|nr:bifunctional adenosylcobinamide kinase/adenosylcobinamide-phosphate guanylyltransferase [Nitrospirota bacterium]